MRILVLSADYVPGAWSGIGAAVAAQAGAVARQGVHVDVVVPDAAVAGAAARGAGLRVHALGGTRFGLRLDDYDIVHLHSLGMAELALQIRARSQLPLVYTAHATIRDELADHPQARGWERIQEIVLAVADHVVFPSAAERDAAIRRLGGLWARSRVIANGVRAAASRATPSARTGPIVFAGRFAESKGLLLLRDIVAGLHEWSALRFVLAGGHGDAVGRGVVRDLVTRHGERCRTVGWLEPDALERLLAGASMVLIPSRYEPFGMVALESMRVGTPVLAAATGGLRDVVGPESGGMLVHSRRPTDWSAAVLDLWRSTELRSTLARRGPPYVGAHFDADVLAGTLVRDVYRPLAAGTRQ